VECDSDPSSGFMTVKVADTGIGIAKENYEKIFRRFWQGGEEGAFTTQGAGIGLALSLELVHLHRGELDVESQPGRGSVFTVRLRLDEYPLGSRYPVTHDSISGKPGALSLTRLTEAEKNSAPTAEPPPSTPPIPLAQDAETIYILSDNRDMLLLLGLVLNEYRTVCFSNPDEARRAIDREPPRLFISDTIAYNKEQGVELCRAIRENEKLAHIPIIILTAEDAREDVERFYEIGMDAFIEKPFDAGYLRALVRQLLRSRHSIYKRPSEYFPTLGEMESGDEKFLREVFAVIEDNLSVDGFSLDDFASRMHSSRTILNNRLTTLTGKSPMELLRSVRMHRAKELLATGQYNITQVTYLVGYSDPRYFSTRFKHEFGITPSEWSASASRSGISRPRE